MLIKETEELIGVFGENFCDDDEYIEKSITLIVEYYMKNGRHSYNTISKIINSKLDQGEDSIIYILFNIKEFMLLIKSTEKNYGEQISKISSKKYCLEDIVQKLEKLYDHISLEETRIKYNSKMVNESNTMIENNVMNQFNTTIIEFQNKLDQTTNSLNSNIITIVGLFSAIILVFFGGLTSLSNIVSGVIKIKSLDEIKVPLIVILSLGLIMFNTVFLLLYSVSKIVDKNIGCYVNCNSPYYYAYDSGDGYFSVSSGYKVLSKHKTFEEALNVAEKKNNCIIKKLYYLVKKILIKVIFRFPHVFLMNLILIVSIIFLYKNLGL